MSEPIIITGVDATGGLYPIEKMQAHREGRLHRAISVFLFSGGRLLIQQRASSKYHCPGQWANTCCSHPNWGESFEHCAPRRLIEELGIAGVPLVPCAMLDYEADVGGGLREHERVQVFRGDANAETLALGLNPDEVSAIDWASPEALRAQAAQDPDHFTPWFRIYLARWDELGL